MNIVYCRRCASELADTDPTCAGCGAPQARVQAVAALADISQEPAPAVRSIGKLIKTLLATGLSVVFLVTLYTAWTMWHTEFHVM